MRGVDMRGSQSMFALAVFAVLCSLSSISAKPLQVKFSSCLGGSNVADSNARMVVHDVFADLVPGQAAVQQGLIGDGHDVLRVDLIGTVNSTVQGYDTTTNKLATLFTDTSTAHISVFKSATWLCNSLFPADLPQPYYPFNTTYCPLSAGPFAVNLTIPLSRSYALTTLHTQVRIVDTSTTALTLACYDMEFTPYKSGGWYYQIIMYLPIAVAIGFWTVTWAARFATGWIVGSGVAEYGVKEGYSGSRLSLPMGTKRDARMRKWGTMIISGLSGERLSVSSALLRFVTPGLRDVLYYIQYCTVLGMIAVDWPAFAYPILAKGAWADLVWNVTLVQGDDSDGKRINVRPDNYTAPPAFANMMNDPYYPLYLDADKPNSLLDLGPSAPGIESWSALVGLRKQDLFGTCLAIFLCLAMGIYLVSTLLWILHAAFEFTSKPTEVRRNPSRPNLLTSPHGSLGGKEAYESRSFGWGDPDGQQLPTQASLAASKQTTAPGKLRKTWLRFRPKGEAGAFHAAALYGNLLRLIMTFHLPVTIFSIYQLADSDASIVSRVFAALAFVFISVAIPVGILVKMERTPTGKLYEATRTLLSLGPMYNVYLEHKQMFRAFPLAASLIEGIVVGAGQKSGIAQAIVFVVVELAMLIIPAVWYPWGEGASMGSPSAFIGVIRVATAVLVMLLSGTLDMGESANAWIAYAILLLHAMVFVFFILMLLTKLVEGLIRLFGGAHFDESTSPLDSGLFAAIMDLDCLNGVRGGKAAQRKRRKRGSRQLQRNVSAVGSLTTQMMLDRHSEGVARQPVSEGTTPFLTPIPLTETRRQQTSYFPSHQPPLGPPPVERHSSDSRSDEPGGGNIMDAWMPSQPERYSPNRRSAGLPPDEASRSRHLSGSGDKANPYDVKGDTSPRSLSPPALSPPALHIAAPSKPVHTRQNSSSAVIERYDTSAPSSPGAGPKTSFQYPPGREGQRVNKDGLHPPVLTIPRRRSLNNFKDEQSPDRLTAPRKQKRKSKVGNWFGRYTDDPESSTAEESDDELSPSRARVVEPFELVPGSIAEEKKGWLGAIGLRRKKMDEEAELAKDENKARKAALAAASGSVFAGVEAPPPPSRGFVVNRKGASAPSAAPSDIAPNSGSSSPPPERSFRVKRPGPSASPQSTSTSDQSAPRVVFTSVSGSKVDKNKETTAGFKVLSRNGAGSSTTARDENVGNAGNAGEFGSLAATGYPPSSFVPMSDREATQRYSGDTLGDGYRSLPRGSGDMTRAAELGPM